MWVCVSVCLHVSSVECEASAATWLIVLSASSEQTVHMMSLCAICTTVGRTESGGISAPGGAEHDEFVDGIWLRSLVGGWSLVSGEAGRCGWPTNGRPRALQVAVPRALSISSGMRVACMCACAQAHWRERALARRRAVALARVSALARGRALHGDTPG